ncbi:Glycosyl transferase family 21 [Raineyella antarctica]|uniref:Glycosyl transferase family 21 n=1 Tax=Raineyella antarctica TaxID=1577474 RepID=A0A1G6GL41_9ACTN|nr:glycosyltransferase family 2 protein [Raineyella antarctica]SDB82728.1 Glycosyl transferase family 21 [Raineyella antarctica]
MSRPDLEYVLPLRWSADADLADLTGYLAELARSIDVTVVDGSDPEAFRRHHEAWAGTVRHVRPQPWPGRNGKVRNVVSGVRLARHPLVVVADDDVRWAPDELDRLPGLMEGVDLLVPQNVFTSWPWHARWDTARQLVNRAGPGDYPGTLVVRRDRLAPDGYEGDVLFENLELIRTIKDRGGVVRRAPWLYVGRRPPSAAHFWSQRVRQAYDDFAQPGRLATEAGLLPLLLVLCLRRPRALVGLALAAVLVAEAGRRRAGGTSRFPASSAWWAPVWFAERAVCVWLAIGRRLTGGVRYGDGRIVHAATPRRRRSSLRAERTIDA